MGLEPRLFARISHCRQVHGIINSRQIRVFRNRSLQWNGLKITLCDCGHATPADDRIINPVYLHANCCEYVASQL
jgi:hypothetical protein